METEELIYFFSCQIHVEYWIMQISMRKVLSATALGDE